MSSIKKIFNSKSDIDAFKDDYEAKVAVLSSKIATLPESVSKLIEIPDWCSSQLYLDSIISSLQKVPSTYNMSMDIALEYSIAALLSLQESIQTAQHELDIQNKDINRELAVLKQDYERQLRSIPELKINAHLVIRHGLWKYDGDRFALLDEAYRRYTLVHWQRNAYEDVVYFSTDRLPHFKRNMTQMIHTLSEKSINELAIPGKLRDSIESFVDRTYDIDDLFSYRKK